MVRSFWRVSAASRAAVLWLCYSAWMAPTLILDTCVVIAGLRSSLGASFALLELVGTGRFTLGLTVPLVLEYEATCMKSLPDLNLTAAEVGELLDYFCHVA